MKILLNSLYGALLNEALRFYSANLGQSVTLTGRSIVRHMNAIINQLITGEYDYLGKSICYADTDSCYFTAAHLIDGEPTRDDYIEMYDTIAEAANDTFARFMDQTFNTGLERGSIIKAGRELICSKMLFIKKKKYGGLIYDLEGKRQDVGKEGKLKAMGLDLKRSDTPKFMQTFLEGILMDVLTGAGEPETLAKIKDFRQLFKTRPAWEKGSPKKVNNLTKYGSMMEKMAAMGLHDKRTKHDKAKQMIPGHVVASINWNKMCDVMGDKYSMRITDGSRIVVCRLKPNHTKMTAIAFPVDELHLPKWFKELPFDHAMMENIIIDKKITNLLGCMNWSLKDTHIMSGDEFFSFG